MKDLVLLKIGGSVITDKKKAFTENRKAINRLSKEIRKGYNPRRMKLILIHGAGSFGHHMVHKNKIHKGIRNSKQLVDFAETQTVQNRFNAMVTESLQSQRIPAIPILASSTAVMHNIRLKHMCLDGVKELLKIGMVPVLYGVPAVDTKQKCSILSGDMIMSWIGKELKPDKIIHATDVDGIYTADPKRSRKAKLIKEITLEDWRKIKNGLTGSSSVDVTGGMFLKVSEMITLAKLGISSQFINASRAGNVEKALKGKKVKGTLIKA
ncbi:MAG: isopentenyl phosphate kinase family protein [Candidatus Aenigmarchaeota archaeon]|nr:isopentenyl phosphate kinase family protein [Candidatus Aenigmarchaeota archaeon]